MTTLRAFVFASALLSSRLALAEPGFATPPGKPVSPERRGNVEVQRDTQEVEPLAPDADIPSSTARVSVGPALRLADIATDGGLAAALDLGSGSVGARLTGTWVRVGSDAGLSQYGVDLWVDFGEGRRLHPLVGAGAGIARMSETTPEGSHNAWTYGVGTLRGSLEYVLPVERADARAGIDAVACVPAVQATHAPDVTPFVLFAARVGIGF